MKLDFSNRIRVSSEKKIFAGFLINTIIILVLGWLIFKRDQNSRDYAAMVDHQQMTNIQLERIKADIRNVENKTELHVITKDEKYVTSTLDAIYSLRTSLRHLSELAESYPEQQKEVDDLEKLINEKIGYTVRIIEFRKYKSFDEAVLELIAEESSGLTGRIDREINNIANIANTSLEESKRKHDRLNSILDWAVLSSFLFLVVLLIAVYFIIKWHLKARKEAQASLQTNAQLLQSIINNTTNPIFIKDVSGKYLLINKHFEKLFHHTNEEIRGKTDHHLFPKEIADKLRAADLDAVKKGAISVEELVPQDDGLHTYISMKFPLFDGEGNLYGVGGVATDITERKKLEHELAENEKQVQVIYRAAPEAVIVINEQGRVINWNPKATFVFGWKEEEVLGKYMHELIMPARYHQEHQRGIERFLSTGEGPILNKTIEVIAVHKNGSEFDIELSIAPCQINGKYIFIGFMRDITQRKRLQKEIQESRKFLHSIIENIPSMIVVKNAEDLGFVEINKACESLLGCSRGEVIGKTNYDLFTNEQAMELTAADRRVLKQGKAIEIPEEIVSTPKGNRVLRIQKLPIFDETGKVEYILDISEDITERKELEKAHDEAEKLLRENEARIKLILENIGEGVIVADTHEKVVLSNSMAHEILDSTEKFYDWSDNYEIFYADGETLFPAQYLPLERAIKGKSTNEMELVLRNNKTNEEKRIKVSGSPVKDEKGNIIAGVTTMKDITQYKALERALEESEVKYRNLIGFKRKNDNPK